MIEYTFSKQQTTSLHNAKCALFGCIQRLEHVVYSDLLERLQAVFNQINVAFEPMYNKEKSRMKRGICLLKNFPMRQESK